MPFFYVPDLEEQQDQFQLPRPNYPSMDQIMPGQIQQPIAPNVYPQTSPAPIPIKPAERLLPDEEIPLPRRQDYNTSRGRTVLNAIAAGLAGASGGPWVGLKTGETLRDLPYNRAMKDYETRVEDQKRRLGIQSERYKRGEEETKLGVEKYKADQADAIKDIQNNIRLLHETIQNRGMDIRQQSVDQKKLMDDARIKFLQWKKENPDPQYAAAKIMATLPGPERDALIEVHQEWEAGNKWKNNFFVDANGNVSSIRNNPASNEFEPPVFHGKIGKPMIEPGQYTTEMDEQGRIIRYVNVKSGKAYTPEEIGVSAPAVPLPGQSPNQPNNQSVPNQSVPNPINNQPNQSGNKLPPNTQPRRAGLTSPEMARRAYMDVGIKHAEDVLNIASKHKEYLGFGTAWKNKLQSKFFGGVPADAVRMYNLLDYELINWMKEISGQQISEREAQRLKDTMPNANTHPDDFFPKLQRFLETAKEIRDKSTGANEPNKNLRTTPGGLRYEVIK